MEYTPRRIYVKLAPDASRALGERARQHQIDDPRLVAADLLRQALGLTPLCPQCENPTFRDPERPSVFICHLCNEPVSYIPPTESEQ